MTAHTTTYVECDGDRCAFQDDRRRRIYGDDLPAADNAARLAGWLVEMLPTVRHLCPVDQPGAKCLTPPLGDYEHIGPWEPVEPWQDVSRCVACGHESGK